MTKYLCEKCGKVSKGIGVALVKKCRCAKKYLKEIVGLIYEPAHIHIAKGDIITSKKGMLNKSPLSNNHYLVKKTEYLGDNRWRAIEREPTEVIPIKQEQKERKE